MGRSGPVEEFLGQKPVDAGAARSLHCFPPHLRRHAIDRGDPSKVRESSAVLIARGSKVNETGGNYCKGGGKSSPASPPRKSWNPGLEAMISKYNLDERAASALRSLSPASQNRALGIDLSPARRPSPYLMTQLRQKGLIKDAFY